MEKKEEVRKIIKHLTLNSVQPREIETQLRHRYGDRCPDISTIRHWYREFQRGRQSVKDDPRSGRPRLSTDVGTIELCRQIVENDRKVSNRELSQRLGISRGSVFNILRYHLGMRKLNARWIPKNLNDMQKQHRVQLCRDFLSKFGANFNYYIKRLITSDETWIHYDSNVQIDQAKEWCYQTESRPQIPRVTNSTKKVMATVFWDCQGILFIDYLPKGLKMDSKYYSNLIEKLKSEIPVKRPSLANRKIYLLIDNAPIHKSAMTLTVIKNCGFTLIDHPPYSPDLAPSDYYLFRNLKFFLKGRKFTDLNEIQIEVDTFFESKDSNYFFRGIEQLVENAKKCIDRNGEYID